MSHSTPIWGGFFMLIRYSQMANHDRGRPPGGRSRSRQPGHPSQIQPNRNIFQHSSIFQKPGGVFLGFIKKLKDLCSPRYNFMPVNRAPGGHDQEREGPQFYFLSHFLTSHAMMLDLRRRTTQQSHDETALRLRNCPQMPHHPPSKQCITR
jgi:hypothetical protein